MNGDGQYLSIPANTAFSQNTAFTHELWFYPTSITSSGQFFAMLQPSFLTVFWDGSHFSIDKSYVGIPPGYTTQNRTYAINNWYHVALSWNNVSSGYLFINGVVECTFNTAGVGTLTDNQPLTFGKYGPSYGSTVTGFYTNMRVVKGVAVYTGAFTPPTSPLQLTQSSGTNISAITAGQTQLLLNTFYGANFLQDATGTFTVTNGGSVQSNTLSPFITVLPPTNLALTPAVGSTATLSWTASAGATGYSWIVYQSATNGYNGTSFSTGSTNSTTYTATVSGLNLASYYYFTVIATGTTNSAAAVSAIMYELPDSPTPTITTTGTTVNMSWTAITGALYYTYTVYQASGYAYSGTQVATANNGTSLSATYSGIAGNYYYFTVSVTTSVGTSALATSGIGQAVTASPFNPNTVATTNLWIDATDPLATGTVPSNGTSLTTVKDKSTSAFTFTTTGSAYSTSAVNSRPAINISTNPLIYNPGTASNNWQEVFVVAVWNGASTFPDFNGLITGNSASSADIGFIGLPGGTSWYSVGWLVGTPWINGTQTSTFLPALQSPSVVRSAASSVQGITGMRIGTDRTYAGRQWNGYVSEVISYGTALSSNQRQQVEAYLAWKWGTQASLPANHPYYSAAPNLSPANPILVSSGGSATMSWTAALNATGYIWSLYQSATNAYAGSSFATGTTTSALTATTTGLNLNYYYYFTVAATGAGTSPAVASAIVLQRITGPATATLIISSAVLSLSWAAVSGATSYTYTIYSNTVGSYTGMAFVSTTSTASTSASYTGVADTYYYFTVTATTASGTSAPTVSAVTSPYPTMTGLQIYCSYNGGTRGANYTIAYSDNGTTFTDAFSGNMTSSSCGIITGVGSGNGSYGAHKWWRFTVGTPTSGHFPRSARIDLLAGSTVYNLVTYVADNCSDQGGIPGGDSPSVITKSF
jgi:fibronectin type 3 domain-containing protein